MNKKISLVITLFIFLTGCGYEIVNRSAKKYNIVEISTSGDQRTSYKIKNKLLFNLPKDSKYDFILNINTKIDKIIKDKNIKNEITSYTLIITTEVLYSFLGQLNTNSKFIINESGEYKVSAKRLNTLKNEKNLKELLTNNIIRKIKVRLDGLTSDY